MNEEQKISKTKIYDTTSTIAIYLMLYLTSGYALGFMLGGTMQLLLQFAIVGIVMFSMMLSTKKLYINSKTLVFMIVLIALIIIGDWWRGETQKQTRISIITFALAYLFSLCFDFKGFAKKYTKIMYFLCICSLILWGTYMVAPGLVQKLPRTYNSVNNYAYNVIIASISPSSSGLARNQGIFWEPGAFQVFVNIALIFDLFYLKNTSKKRLLIFLVTLFTTFSTTGYLSAIFIIYAYITLVFLKKDVRNSKNITTLLFIMTIGIILIIIFLTVDSPVIDKVFGKLTNFIEFNEQNVTGAKQHNSVSVRLDSIIEPIKYMLEEKKFFGIGYSHSYILAYKTGYNMQTCTFLNLITYYGIIFALMIISGYYKFSKIVSKSFFVTLLIFISLFLLSISENLARNISFLVFAFLAISHNPQNDEIKTATNKEQINEKNIRN